MNRVSASILATIAWGVSVSDAAPAHVVLRGAPPTAMPIEHTGWGDAFRAWINGCRYGER